MAKFDVNKTVESLKPFAPEEKYGHMSIAKINSVKVVMTEAKTEDDKGIASTYEYAGCKVPNLVFEFQQVFTEADAPERFHFHYEKPVVTLKNDGTLVTDENINILLTQMFDRILHIYKTFSKSPNYKPFVEKEIPEILETAAIDVRLESYTKFFEYIAKCFNEGKAIEGKDGKVEYLPVYKDDKKKSVLVWLKLIANYPDNKRLVLPNFIGKGFIEVFKASYPKPSIMFEGKETYILKTINDSASKGSSAKGGATAATSDDEDISDDLKSIIEQS